MTAGYSTNAIADQLGLKPGMRAFVVDIPDDLRSRIALDDLGLTLLAAPSSGIDVALVFVTTREALDRQLSALQQLLAPGGFIWIAWPGGDTGQTTEITQDDVRAVAQTAGLSTTDTCALDDGWSATQLAIRKE